AAIGLLGEDLRPPVIGHLQAVLDAAEIPVGVDQIVGSGPVDAPGRDQRVERVASRARSQARVPAAVDQLLRLREELDLADTAAPDLDVVPGNGHLGAATMSVDLALDRVDVLDRREVEIAAPDIGPDALEELGAG